VLAGTHQNLGPGGYAPSPLQDVLPVRMPQREERRDPSVSLVLIVDTSGSMGGGRLELAKEVARLAIQKLQPHDKVGLIEFHGSKRWAAPLQPGTNTIEITRALNRLQVGGGTIIYEALEESLLRAAERADALPARARAHRRRRRERPVRSAGAAHGHQRADRLDRADRPTGQLAVPAEPRAVGARSLLRVPRQVPDARPAVPRAAVGSLLPAVQERTVPLERTGDAEATAAFADDHLRPSGGIVEASVRQNAEVLLRGTAGEPWLIGWDQGAAAPWCSPAKRSARRVGKLHDDACLRCVPRGSAAQRGGSGQSALLPELRTPDAGARRECCGCACPRERTAAGGAECALGRVRRSVRMVDDGDGWVAFLPWAGTAGRQIDVVAGDGGVGAVALRCRRRTRTPSHVILIAAELDAHRRGHRRQPTRLRATRVAGRTGRTFAAGASEHAFDHHARGCSWHSPPACCCGACRWRRGGTGRAHAGTGRHRWRGSVLLLAGGVSLPAQQPGVAAPTEEATVRAAIDHELRERGDLGDSPKPGGMAPRCSATGWRGPRAIFRRLSK
jgi:hypothetical protein